MADDSMLAVFVDRTTMRHERTYPHAIESVWEAVTTSEQLNVWLLPVSKVERRLRSPLRSRGVVRRRSVSARSRWNRRRRSLHLRRRTEHRFELFPVVHDPPVLHPVLRRRTDATRTTPIPVPTARRADSPWRPVRRRICSTSSTSTCAASGPRPIGRGTSTHRSRVARPDYLRMVDIYRDHIRAHAPMSDADVFAAWVRSYARRAEPSTKEHRSCPASRPTSGSTRRVSRPPSSTSRCSRTPRSKTSRTTTTPGRGRRERCSPSTSCSTARTTPRSTVARSSRSTRRSRC